jgi:hypothetical protein
MRNAKSNLLSNWWKICLMFTSKNASGESWCLLLKLGSHPEADVKGQFSKLLFLVQYGCLNKLRFANALTLTRDCTGICFNC